MNKKEVIKNIAIIVLVPAVLVGAYYGGMYLHKKYKEKKGNNGDGNSDSDNKSKKSSDLDSVSVDTTGMENYIINIPFKYQKDLFTNGEFFNSISKIKYSPVSNNVVNDEGNNPSVIKVEIMALSKDIPEIKNIIEKLNKEITIESKV